MRAALVLLIALSSVAHADRILVMTDDEMASALDIAMASRHADVTNAASPSGALRLDRAAAVQRAAIASGANAGVWIDANEVCVVSADGANFRHTPLPLDASPRVFAAIATSLLDELLAPPNINIDVHVDVGPPPVNAQSLTLTPPTLSTGVIAEAPRESWQRTHLELGPTLSPSSYGAELELTFPLLPNLRVGILGGANQLFDGIRDIVKNTQMYDAAGEIRYVGTGDTHFDVGLAGGIMRGTLDDMSTDTGGFAALRFSYTKEYAHSAVSFSVAPMMLFDFRGQGDDRNFGVMTSLRVELPI
jgi:hypothetical protein